MSRNFVATPLGAASLWLDGEPCACDRIWEIPVRRGERFVDGNVRMAYRYEPDALSHVLECRIDSLRDCESSSASGERLEAIEANDGRSCLVVAVEYDFEDYAQGHDEYQYDYRASVCDLGVVVDLPADARAQWIVFGVSWVNEANDENVVNPWLAADPFGDRQRLRSGVLG
ncbi:MAG: hypothetical protein Q4B35_05300 [Slackia sp.]|nr:hypothetical protein [Slackia sp.]